MANRRSRVQAALISIPRHTKCKVALMWVRQSSPVYRLLSTNVLREVCQFLDHRPLFGVPCASYLIVFDPLLKSSRKIDFAQVGIATHYDIPGECVCIGEEKLFICGGVITTREEKLPTSSTFVLDCEAVNSLRNMRRGRFWHRLYYDEASRAVFSFGGVISPWDHTKSCEQYEICSNSWTSLPDMHEAKSCIKICGHRHKVYLCGRRSGCLEIFTIASKQFAVAPIQVTSITSSIPVIWKGRLLIFHMDSVRMLDIDTYALVAEFTIPQLFSAKYTVVINDKLIGLSSRECTSIDLRTMSVGKIPCTQ